MEKITQGNWKRQTTCRSVKRPCHFCHFSLSILFPSTISYFHFFVTPIEVGLTILIHSISISQSRKMTSLFCPGQHVLFSVTSEWRNWKLFTFNTLESETFDLLLKKKLFHQIVDIQTNCYSTASDSEMSLDTWRSLTREIWSRMSWLIPCLKSLSVCSASTLTFSDPSLSCA